MVRILTTMLGVRSPVMYTPSSFRYYMYTEGRKTEGLCLRLLWFKCARTDVKMSNSVMLQRKGGSPSWSTDYCLGLHTRVRSRVATENFLCFSATFTMGTVLVHVSKKRNVLVLGREKVAGHLGLNVQWSSSNVKLTFGKYRPVNAGM